MRSSLRVAAVSALFLTSTQAAPTSPSTIQWFACPQNESIVAPYECGTLQVPLDYTLPEYDTLELKMVRVSHTKEPFMGSILFNAGGPGLETRSLVAGGGEGLLELTGGHFDLIGHDPRGTGDTLPFHCYNESERALSLLATPASTDSSDAAPGQIFAERKILSQACVREHEDSGVGELVGTAFTIRDLFQIVDALGEDGLLRYWGFSYGSALGATAAAMFPDRIDKLIIDAVLNLQQYYDGRDYQQVYKADAGLRHFLGTCLKAPDACILSQQGSSVDEIETKIWEKLESIRQQPLATGPTINDLIKYGSVTASINTGLRQPMSPIGWPLLAQLLSSLITSNTTGFREAYDIFNGFLQATDEPSWPAEVTESPYAIRCSDHSFRADNLSDLVPVYEEFERTSKLTGGWIAGGQPMSCAQWPWKAKEQIQWKSEYVTRSPLLVIGNTWDTLTPVESAFNTSASFPGSGVVHQNTGGHGSIAHPSTCTANAIRAYLVNGTLPSGGSVLCEPDEPLGVFASTDSSSKKRSLMSEEDTRLYEAMEKLARRALY
ncbi:hypothetical protein PMZ80_005682 [Knufia obscura]|uniref:Peptidase S33 tripeptidyl aminopeptidase-like C-terminal domain-containing protein n=1 Tax=Knufia obscura TaxID=1635080 RepID=A0ABR0RM99_9EURO|nr:hypothetical protein PMZ80_005682 [Knufia obscura]